MSYFPFADAARRLPQGRVRQRFVSLSYYGQPPCAERLHDFVTHPAQLRMLPR